MIAAPFLCCIVVYVCDTISRVFQPDFVRILNAQELP